MGRLMLAGRGWDNNAGPAAWVSEAKVVRLEADGSWAEVHSTADRAAWYLREYTTNDYVSHLFHLTSTGGGIAERPWRGSLYRSEDEGDNWVDVSPPLGYCGGISRGAGDRLWAITDPRPNPVTVNGGPSRIYYSDDWGDTWVLSHTIAETSFGTRGWPLFNIAAHPTDANKVVVEGIRMVGADVRMWSTSDGGATWSAAFDPTFPVAVGNVGGQLALSLEYASDGSMVYSSGATVGSGIIYIFRSTDDGANWVTYWSGAGFTLNRGIQFIEDCPSGYLWFIMSESHYRAPDWLTPPTLLGTSGAAPFGGAEYFMGVTCHDGALSLGVVTPVPDPGCCEPPGVYERHISLSAAWVKQTRWDNMDADLGYRLYPWASGILGATPYYNPFEQPCDETLPGIPGSPDPYCIPMLSWEISVDGKNFFTQSLARGMGSNNPGQSFVAELPEPEIWSPASTKYGEEGGSYNVHRQLIVNDFGVNEAAELENLGGAYLTSPGKKWHGITTIKYTVGGLPRAGPTAPHPGKILQAGDQIKFGCGSEASCGIAEGDWIVDEVSYEMPKGITTVIASRRPAAQAIRTRGASGNIRNLGETIANEFGSWESPWFTVEDTEFFMNPNAHDADKFYGVFKMEHYMGVIPRIYIVIAAKKKIYDWYDNEAVIEAQPLYVPRQFLDISQVQGVGYNLVGIDEIQAIFHFWRYLFYDGIDGNWILPEERFLKIWLIA